MKVYELINMLQECNQMATIIATVDLSWKLDGTDGTDIKIIPQNIESRRAAEEIELSIMTY